MLKTFRLIWKRFISLVHNNYRLYLGWDYENETLN